MVLDWAGRQIFLLLKWQNCVLREELQGLLIRGPLVDFYRMGPFKHAFHVTIGIWFFVNILGNLLMGIFVNTTLGKYSKGLKYCDECKKDRPAESWHCSRCNFCVVRRDHHCYMMSRCIGLNNYRYFFLFMFHVFFSMLYSTYYLYYFVSLITGKQSYYVLLSVLRIFAPIARYNIEDPLSFHDVYVVFLLLNIGLICWSGYYLNFHFKNMLMGLTSREYKPLDMKVVKKHWKRNIERVLGKNCKPSGVSQMRAGDKMDRRMDRRCSVNAARVSVCTRSVVTVCYRTEKGVEILVHLERVSCGARLENRFMECTTTVTNTFFYSKPSGVSQMRAGDKMDRWMDRRCSKRNHKICSNCWKTNNKKKPSPKPCDSAFLCLYAEEPNTEQSPYAEECLLSEECFLSSDNNDVDDRWVLDSGCTSHMTFHSEYFQNMKKTSRKLQFASKNFSSDIEGEGRVTLSSENRKIHLENALYVPDLCKNLLSLSRMTKNGARATFYDNVGLVYNKNGILLMIAEKSDKNGLYYIKSLKAEECNAAIDDIITPSTQPQTIKQNSIQNWHRKLDIQQKIETLASESEADTEKEQAYRDTFESNYYSVLAKAQCLIHEEDKKASGSSDLGWDQPVPDEISQIWKRFVNNLSLLNKIRVPRFVMCEHPVVTELHMFVDASLAAYGACAYTLCVVRHTKNYNTCIAEFLVNDGFEQSEADPCLYYRTRGRSKVLIGLYVDDGLVAANTTGAADEFIKELKGRFKITTKPASYFLGMEIKAEKGKITLHQQAYTKKLLEKFGMQNSKPTPTPIIKENTSNDDEEQNRESKTTFNYRQAVGALTYLSVGTRPDISYAVNKASRNLESPTRQDFASVKRIFRYLKGTVEKGLVYCQTSPQHMICYSDSDFAGDIPTGRSTSGMVCLLSGAAISWRSARQTIAFENVLVFFLISNFKTLRLVSGQSSSKLPVLMVEVCCPDDVVVGPGDEGSPVASEGSEVSSRRSERVPARHKFRIEYQEAVRCVIRSFRTNRTALLRNVKIQEQRCVTRFMQIRMRIR
ncbi:DHHC palmitoyltransferase domain-containing protein [Phthorimaea operculella]|nr:DHHC palmitoyltransferase domain-containing protein [Phthorimaea operculella]